VTEVIGGVLAILGSALVALAGAGVVRFRDLYSRMHAATKAPTLGFMLITAAALVAVDMGRGKLALAVALILVTAPVAAHLVARSAHRWPEGRRHIDTEDHLGARLDGDERADR
jgi:multicomponent Na+:H+ antiporter subunit G